MAILKVIEWPAKVLDTPAKEVTVFDDRLRQFVANMVETMHASHGIGLAANQVNDLRRVIIIEIPFAKSRYADQEDEKQEWWHNQRFIFVNPIIKKKQGKIRYQEGCLSFPEIFDYVDRAAEVWVTARDEFGKEFDVHATGLLAVALQHEIDHIDGMVFINRMSRLKSVMIRKQIQQRQLETAAEIER